MKLLIPISFALSAIASGACGKVDPAAVGGPWSKLAPDAEKVDPATGKGEGEGHEGADPSARPDLAADVNKLVAKTRLSERREAVVDMVWVRGEGPTADGGTTACTIRVEPNTSNEASVGIIEEFAGGGGDMSKAAAWIAAIVSSETAGYLLTDHEFLVRLAGHGDGPSAGMLTAAGMLALLTDTPVLQNTTMSGTINPDGSAGPVGGLVQKMHGAKAKGKTRFGYPVGTRNTKDYRTGQMVDLEVIGRELGMEVVEIDDLAEAYEFMTGKTLPPPTLATDADMALDPDLRTRVKAKLLNWQADLNSRASALGARVAKMRPELKAYVMPVAQQIDETLREAQTFERNGLDVPAYNRMIQAGVTLRIAVETTDVLELWMKGDLQGIDQRISALAQVDKKIEALALELGISARKKTVGGVVNVVSAYAYYNVATAFMQLGVNGYRNALQILELIQQRKIPNNEEALTTMRTQLLLPVGYFAAADAVVQAARESMDFAPEEGAALELDMAKLNKLTRTYASAASAGLANFEATIVKSEAEANNVSMAQAKAFFGQLDASYLLAQPLADYAGRIQGDKPETALVRLSAGVMSYMTSASLINKYYSLTLKRQPDGSTKLEGRRALSSQLELARRSALAAAGEAKKLLGFVPSTARIAYEDAMALREGSDEDKLEALNEYWLSAFWSRLTITLVRK